MTKLLSLASWNTIKCYHDLFSREILWVIWVSCLILSETVTFSKYFCQFSERLSQHDDDHYKLRMRPGHNSVIAYGTCFKLEVLTDFSRMYHCSFIGCIAVKLLHLAGATFSGGLSWINLTKPCLEAFILAAQLTLSRQGREFWGWYLSVSPVVVKEFIVPNSCELMSYQRCYVLVCCVYADSWTRTVPP